MRTVTKITIIAAAGLALAGLSGCAGKTTASNTTTPAVSVSAAPSATPTDTTSASPTTSAIPTQKSTPALASCASSSLSAAIVADAGGGTAGSTYVSLVLTNKGAIPCTLQGWPGVSFVGGGNGTQIGQAAAFDKTSSHAVVTLAASGGTAKSTLRVVQAGNYSAADCKPTKADGFRVYPPGQRGSLFASKTGFTACASTKVSLLTVSGLK